MTHAQQKLKNGSKTYRRESLGPRRGEQAEESVLVYVYLVYN